jgi:ATP-dependent exoDNAse (exonuclease V) beta subunit
MKTMNDYQAAREQINDSCLVSASAGTGKTRVLVERYLNILKSKQTGIEEIIAITFTEKAAGEMKDRIRQAIRDEDDSAGLPVAELLDRLSTAPISTIHGFCARVLQENIGELDLDPQFRVIDEIEDSILRKESLDYFLHRKLRDKQDSILSLMSHFDLYHIRDMLNNIWDKRADGLKYLDSISAQQPDELFKHFKLGWERYTLQLLDDFFREPLVANALVQFGKFSATPKDSLQKSITIIQSAEKCVRQNIVPSSLWDKSLNSAFSSAHKGRKENWGNELEELRNLFGPLKDKWSVIKEKLYPFEENIERRNVLLLSAFSRLAREWLNYYQNILKDKGVIDFSGLEVETERFLSGGSAAARKFAQRYTHLLVDEFQDISPIQNRIFEALINLNRRLISFFVGDEKQSIYRFRGAEVEIFNRRKKLKPPLYLDKNFRSVKGLIDFYNPFFRFLFDTSSSKANYEVSYDAPVKTNDVTHIEKPVTELLVVNTEQDETREADNAALTGNFSNVQAEATQIVQRMMELHQQPIVKQKEGGLRPAEWRDYTILLRSRNHQNIYEMVLQKAGIPYYVSSGLGFYQRREVLDVINFIRTLLNWYDESALIATLRSPMVGISDKALFSFSTDKGFMDGIRKILDNDLNHFGIIDQHYIRQIRDFHALYERLYDKISILTTAELIREILNETDYLSILAAFPDGNQRIANVLKLVDLALEWSAVQEISPVDFLRRIQLYQTMQIREGEANLSSEIEDSVTIMTIHASKGLSFPIVIVPQLAANIKSNKNRLLFHYSDGIALNLKTSFQKKHSFIYQYLSQIDHERSLAEERRLLYVAATRAESHLILSAIQKSAGKSKNSLWHIIEPFFDNPSENLYVKRENSLENLEIIFKNLRPQSENIICELSESDKIRLKETVLPVSVKTGIEKITPTAFAGWVVNHYGKIAPNPHKTMSPELTLSEKTLSAIELGTLIHRAFSWWDFQNTGSLLEYTEQLLSPYFLQPYEKEKTMNRVMEWGNNFLNPSNSLYGLINSAAQIDREIDIDAILFDVLIEGKIDLLLKMPSNDYVVIDFKSDYIRNYPDDSLLTKYNAQLNLYALMLNRWSKASVARTGLYFIRNGLLIEQVVDEGLLKKTENQLKLMIRELSENTAEPALS